MADGGIAVMQWPREEKGSLEDIDDAWARMIVGYQACIPFFNCFCLMYAF